MEHPPAPTPTDLQTIPAPSTPATTTTTTTTTFFLQKLVDFCKNKKTQVTLVYCLGFLSLGLVLASFGPSFKYFQKTTNATVSQLGLTVTIRALGYLIGSAIGGPLFDKYSGNILLASGFGFAAVGTALIPFATSVYLLGTFAAFQGFGMGFGDAGANVLLIYLHGKEVEPYMQAMHFAFSLGAFFGPLVVGLISKLFEEDLSIGFWLMAVTFIPMFVALFYYESPRDSSKKLDQPANAFTPHERVIITLTGFYLLVYVGAEVTAGTYLYEYTVHKNLASESTAYIINSVFWGSFALGRLIAVPISVWVTAEQMLLVDMIGFFVSMCMMWIFNYSSVVLWISSILLGLSLASCFPTAINLAEVYMKVTGRAASYFVIGASFGEMSFPFLVGLFIPYTNYMALVYGLFFGCLSGSVVFLLLVWRGRANPRQDVGPTNQQTSINLNSNDVVAENENDSQAQVLIVSNNNSEDFQQFDKTEENEEKERLVNPPNSEIIAIEGNNQVDDEMKNNTDSFELEEEQGEFYKKEEESLT